jgi:4-amino-4-deoxy-L-arabinose transferase-like glycosyltransferase
MRRPGRRDRVWLFVILAVFTLSVVYAISRAAPFEVDESVYAAQARAWATGGPVTGILPHRAPLLPAIGAVLYKAGARAEWPFRLIGLVFGILAVTLAWALGRAVSGPRSGLMAAAIFAGAPTIQLRSSQFMTDVPAAAFLLAAALILWNNREHAGPSVLLFAPAAAGAFYARYASILPIVLLALVALVLWHKALLARPVLLAGVVVLFTALLIPHVVHSIDTTSRPWGLITFTERYAGRRYVGQGLRDYVYWLPAALAGPVAGIVMIVGLVAALFRSKNAVFLVVPAVLDIVLIGLTDHGEARFVFFPIALLCIAGSAVVVRVRPLWPTAAVVAGALVLGGVFLATRTNTQRTLRAPPVLAGRAIAARASRPCAVLAVDVGPTTWYSGCSTYYFNDKNFARADFMLIYRAGGSLLKAQPAALPLPHGPPIPVVDPRGREVATVYQVRRPVQ